MEKINLALISGGTSSERDVSLAGGNEVFEVLDKSKYNIRRYDPKTDLPLIVRDAPEIDVALLVLHGRDGEDGTLQGMLDLLKIPYQGSGVLGSAIAMNKLISKRIYEHAGIPVPPYVAVQRNAPVDVDAIVEKLGLPLFVKPVCGGSSIGMSMVKEKEALTGAIERAFAVDESVLVEACVEGVELTCAVMGNRTLEALPVVQIVPGEKNDFFDYEAKYTPGATREICPAPISEEIERKVKAYARKAHEVLTLKGYSRTDMILSGDRLHVLETNTIPGMTRTSLLPLAAETAGISFSALIEKLIALALEEKDQA